MSHHVTQRNFDPARAALYESLFMVGNGHFGIRGAEEEQRHTAFRGCFINGFFEKKPIRYGEWAYGYAKNHETILNVADIASIELSVDGFLLDFASGAIEGYERHLDLDGGRLERDIVWVSPSASRVEVRSSRLVSFRRPDVAAMRYVVLARTAGRVDISSFLDASIRNRITEDGDPRVGSHLPRNPIAWSLAECRGDRLHLSGTTARSRLGISIIARHHALVHRKGRDDAASLPTLEELRAENVARGEKLSAHYSVLLAEGESFILEKFVSVADGTTKELDVLDERAGKAVDEAYAAGYATIEAEQQEDLTRFWRMAGIQIDGDPSVEEGLRFNMFHLFQSAGRDGRTSLAAKGLSGEGYEGHYFWDTEIYAMPFFTYEAPKIARALVDYRIGILDKARERARELSLPGALFPWRTIDGEETSAYYPAGTAQFHIDADISYSLDRYARSAGDEAVYRKGGADLLIETARLWMGLGFFNPRKHDRFCIPCVTGPDEYSTLVDNNAYTNLMAEYNLRRAADVVDWLKAEHPDEFRHLVDRLSLSESETAEWRRASDLMYVPYDTTTGIIPQDDHFLDRPVWDLSSTPRSDFPLLLHYHPLLMYRRRVLKQPDTVLALFLRHERFGLSEKIRNFRFYEPLTTGDSSLSHCIQSVMAAECGFVEKAYDYFVATARMDLDDIHGNSRDGVHIAAMAGSWISVVYGFGGMRETEEGLSFRPSLPPRWKRLSFSITYRGSRFACEYERDRSVYRLVEGRSVQIVHTGKKYRITREAPVEIDERPQPQVWIFDLDGVIADTARLHAKAWMRLTGELGILFDDQKGNAVKGVARMAALRIVLGESAVNYDEAELAALAERKNENYKELIARIGPNDIMPGMAGLLTGLRDEGRVLILASASRNAPEILSRLGIDGLFNGIVDPATLAMPKPDPEIFIRAAELCDARLVDCLALEDGQAGIDAIRAAGIFSVGVGRNLLGADICFDDTRSIDRATIEAAFFVRRAAK